MITKLFRPKNGNPDSGIQVVFARGIRGFGLENPLKSRLWNPESTEGETEMRLGESRIHK